MDKLKGKKYHILIRVGFFHFYLAMESDCFNIWSRSVQIFAPLHTNTEVSALISFLKYQTFLKYVWNRRMEQGFTVYGQAVSTVYKYSGGDYTLQAS